jgi:hypothetical protein
MFRQSNHSSTRINPINTKSAPFSNGIRKNNRKIMKSIMIGYIPFAIIYFLFSSLGHPEFFLDDIIKFSLLFIHFH